MDAADPDGFTAFHFACVKNQAECAEALVRAGCGVGLKISDGATGRELAETLGHAAVVERLDALGAERPAGGGEAQAPGAKKKRKKRPKKKRTAAQPGAELELKIDPEFDPEPEPEPEREPDEPEPVPESEPEPEPEPEPELEPEPEPEPEQERPCRPMAEFDEAAVQAWLAAVPGLMTAAQRSALAQIMAEDEYNGADLIGFTERTLRRVLRGSGAEESAPLLLAARDAYLATAPQAAAAEQAVHSCQICFEAYGEDTVPRMLPCGHTFCEDCLNRMLRCGLPSTRA
jgi:hypothetical protein